MGEAYTYITHDVLSIRAPGHVLESRTLQVIWFLQRNNIPNKSIQEINGGLGEKRKNRISFINK